MARCRRLAAMAMMMALIAGAQMRLGEGRELRGTISALLSFGDSSLDTGNNNLLPTLARSNFPPYGRDFPGGRATGRFSNGRLPPDFFASTFELKEFLPPYLSTSDGNELLTGVNFASAGTGFDNLTARSLNVLSFTDQLRLFKEYKVKLAQFAGQQRADSIVANALYLISSGTNDLLNTYRLLRKVKFSISSYVDFLVSAASAFIQQLHEQGARKILVIGIPAIGCVPYIRTLQGGLGRNCVSFFNDAALRYNETLFNELKRLNTSLTGVKIIYIETYTFFKQIVEKPSDYKLKEVTRGCCGTGLLEEAFLCNPLTPTCSNADEYLFWDAVHPTQKGYEILGSNNRPFLELFAL